MGIEITDAYEFVAIGSGPAGESATELAAFFGHRSAVIEKARPGGTVTTTGGVPTKTLREAALYQFSNDGRYLAGMSASALYIWDTATQELLHTVPLASGADAVLNVNVAAGPVKLYCSLFAGTPDSHEAKGMLFDVTAR